MAILPDSSKQRGAEIEYTDVGQRVPLEGHIPAHQIWRPDAEAARTRQHDDQCALTRELGFQSERACKPTV